MSTSRILYVEDDANDVTLLRAELEARAIPADLVHITTENSFLAALADEKPALILADSNVPCFGAREALTRARERCPEVPFFCLTGSITEEGSMDMHAAGVSGCLCKNDLGAVGAVIRRVTEAPGTEARNLGETPGDAQVSQLSLGLEGVASAPRRELAPFLSHSDAKLLFVLLDAVDEEGRWPGPASEGRWRQAKNQFIAEAYEGGAGVFWALLEGLEQSGKFDGTWMQRRWHGVKARVGGESAATPT